MFRIKSKGFFLLFFAIWTNSVMAERLPVNCREIYYGDTKYCSVSFYEILSDNERFDGLNIRIVGYLKYSLEGTALAVNEISFEGTMIEDNIIGVHVSEHMKDSFKENDGKLVVLYGKYKSTSDRYFMARGEFSSVDLVEPHL